MMFGQGGPVKVSVATRPVDFRKGIDGLALAVQERFGLDPFCGAVFVFRAKRADRIKLLVWDQTGMVLVHKRTRRRRCTTRPTEDYRDMVYAETKAAIEARRKAFLRKWRLKCPAVADSLEEEAGDRLFTFTRLDPSQWKSARTTNAIERLHEEFRRWIKTQAVLPDAETAPMLFWALLASGQIVMRKVDGWETLSRPLDPETLDLAA